MASTSAESTSTPIVAVEGNLRLVSSDGVEALFALRDLKKASKLEKILSDMGVDFSAPDTLQDLQVPLPSVPGDALSCIVRWCALHADEEPRSDEHRQTHRFNRNVAKEDVELLDEQMASKNFADIVNAAYFLEMPDLVDTLLKYAASNLKDLKADEIVDWASQQTQEEEAAVASEPIPSKSCFSVSFKCELKLERYWLVGALSVFLAASVLRCMYRS
uniref:Skp1_POZ domain-containing protein n=1 Tax=Steinernema glaseri TaxID=37863 RepID=A0A1I7Y8T5_9BILA